MWLGLGHLSVKKAPCLSISFQKQVVNPDVTFEKEQNTIKNLLLPLSQVHTKEERGIGPLHYKDLATVKLLVHTNKKFRNLQLSWSFLVNINFYWDHRGKHNKVYIYHVFIAVDPYCYFRWLLCTAQLWESFRNNSVRFKLIVKLKSNKIVQ